MTPTDFTDVILGLLHRFEAASIKTPAAVVDESPLQAIGKSARETLTVLAFITVRLFERISLSFPPGIENFLAPTDIIPIRRVVKTTTPPSSRRIGRSADSDRVAPGNCCANGRPWNVSPIKRAILARSLRHLMSVS
ncbi:hypothetical protein [Rosistilla oblonga]|uniref:Uncharacterized protein n=1 Tax=Rosistilla oblonga TaxID=2527990 RepID=A0A518IQY3_9BACT|nr:hypothetical protein [Rosistilla oblonga]QDV55463.1 hypothetical protein Mal33_14370 [Rosistilla oblonga]